MTLFQFPDTLLSELTSPNLVCGMTTEPVTFPTDTDQRLPVGALTFSVVEVDSHDRLT